MRRTGETFAARYEAELVLIEFFALLVLLFFLSSGPAHNPVSQAEAPPAAVQPAQSPGPAKEVEQPVPANAKPGKAMSASPSAGRLLRRGVAAVSAGEQL